MSTCTGIRETPQRRPTRLEGWEGNGSRKETGREKGVGESERGEEEEKEEKKEEEEEREQDLQELSRH